MSARLRDLAALAALMRDDALAELSRRSGLRRRAEAQLAALREAQSRGLAGAGPDAAHRAGADAPWLTWSGQAIRSAAAVAAQAAARVEDQKAVARREVGRADVLRQLAAGSRARR